jgi:pyruvate/2-oxoglutarate dehydrogenase complex dihydrolipoamide acyltransferase (E2) component
MITKIVVPPLGEQKQTETLLNSWYVGIGQNVKPGDDIAELVTDKAAFNLPAPVGGKVVKLLVKEGDKVQSGESLVEIETA